MVTDCLWERMGSEPNLSIKQSISIGTMLNFDSDTHGHGDSDGTCKQTLIHLKMVHIDEKYNCGWLDIPIAYVLKSKQVHKIWETRLVLVVHFEMSEKYTNRRDSTVNA